MNKVLCHIVGIDEIHKIKLRSQLPSDIKIVDLDEIQQYVYNHADIVKQKKLWEQISCNVNVIKKQAKLSGSNRTDEIELLMKQRNDVRIKIHQIWKQKMSDIIDTKLKKYSQYWIIIIGFNIYPKDYRVKINISLSFSGTNKIIFDIEPTAFASNQIKYYLDKYSDRIIKGVFQLNLLKFDYLSRKYEKFSTFYQKNGYSCVPADNLLHVITNLQKISNVTTPESINEVQLIDNHSVQLFSQQIQSSSNSTSITRTITKPIYVATIYKSGDIIPVNAKTPIEGYHTRQAAIDSIKSRVKRNMPIYVYQIDPSQFHMQNGKLIAAQALYPSNESSLMLTV